MRKMIFFWILIFVIPGLVFAQKADAPDGFLGFKWGSTTSQFTELEYPRPDCLTDPDTKGLQFGWRWIGRIGEVEVGKSGYMFKNDRFFGVNTNFKKDQNYKIFKQALILKYGEPEKITPLVLKINPNATVGEQCSWRLKTVLITLSYSSTKDEGQLGYSYLPILEERNIEQQKDIEKTKNSL